MADEPKVVPPRNDPKRQIVFARADIADQNSRPGYKRQWFSRNPDHPQYYEKYAGQFEGRVGDPEVGYAKAEPWTVVSREKAAQGRKRDDDTSGIGTPQTHGDLILLETPEENYAVWSEYDRLKREGRRTQLASGDREVIRDGSGRAVASFAARMGRQAGTDDPRSLLNE